MFINYLTSAFRNIIRHKTFSFLNIIGLAVGMTCTILIMSWVTDEINVDGFHANNEHIYRVMQTQYYEGGKANTSNQTPALLGDALKDELPEVAQTVVVTSSEMLLFTLGEKRIKEEVVYAGEDFFEMFTFPLIKGNPKTVPASPDNMVISETLARKYFGNRDPIGKTIRIDNTRDFMVSGVFKDVPLHSSLQFSCIISHLYIDNSFAWAKDWEAIGPSTFVMLTEGAAVARVNSKIKDYLKDKQGQDKRELFLQPFGEMYLYNNFTNGIQDGGRIDYVQLFTLAAFAILLIACINFMNLSTASATKRAKEVGVRKVIGATRTLLTGQFLTEALLCTVFAAGISLLFVVLLLPFFNELSGKQMILPLTQPVFVLSLAAFIVLTGCLAGSYPALFLSSLQPVKVLKGVLKFKPGAVLLRQGLIVFQFVLSILLIIATLLFHQQIKYIQTKHLGFDRQNVLYSSIEGELPTNFNAFKSELSQSPGIQSVSTITQQLLQFDNPTIEVDWPGKNPQEQIPFYSDMVNYGFLKTMNIPLIAGRDFSPAFGRDSLNFILNEEAVKRMNLQNPVGQEIIFWRAKGTVIGVVKNFHLQSLHSSIQPLIIRLEPKPSWGYVLVKAQAGKTEEALTSFAKVHGKYNPVYPTAIAFADEAVEKLYQSERMLGKLSNAFTLLAIFISCLGLFGLTAFSAGQRTKEIGIRKVLGASATHITYLLSKNFMKLVLLAFVVAAPLAWLGMYLWLQNYAYHIDISPWIFAMAGIAALFISLFTMSFLAIKAACANPVDSLRNE